jgi:putative heme transporter
LTPRRFATCDAGKACREAMTRGGGGSDRWAGWWRIAQLVFAFGLVGAVFLTLIPQLADYGSVWRRVTGLTASQITIVAATAVLNLLTYWIQSIAAMPGLTLAMAAVQTQTTTTVANTMPGGGALAVAVSFGMFRSWGYAEGEFARFTLVTGIWNAYVKLGLPVVALGFIAVGGRADPRLTLATVIGVATLVGSVVVLALVLWRERFARMVGRALYRPVGAARRRLHRRRTADWGAAAVRFRKQSIGLVRRRGLALTVTTLASHLSLYAVLLASLRAVGVTASQVTWSEVLAAFAFARLVTALPITPGGLGIVELSYIGALVWAGGVRTDVVAGVLLFRAVTFLLQIPLGVIAYPVWQRTQDRWHRTDRRSGSRSRSRKQRRSRTAVAL